LGHYKKTFFRPLQKIAFFALFEKRQKSIVATNKYKPFMKSYLFVFRPKQAKNTLKKNIVSNLPWITDLRFPCEIKGA
jgi:hypothetical protein